VTVTDTPSGCTSILPNPIVIEGPQSALNVATPVQKTDVICWGYSTGAINLQVSGGWGVDSVIWSPSVPGGVNPTNILAGTYNATVVDQGGCTFVVPPVQVLQPPAVTYGNPVVIHNLCANDGDGAISIQVSGGNGGPYSVSWNGGLTGTTISNLAGGVYAPTITESNTGCTAVLAGITVNEPAPIDTSNVVVTLPTGGQPNGSITLDLSGGTGTLDIKWTGPNNFMATTKNISGLTGGTYNLTIVDDNDCVFTASYNLGALSVVYTATASCGDNGCIDLIISGGVPPYQITGTGGILLDPDGVISICSLAPDVYTLTVADAASNVSTVGPVQVAQLQPALVSSNKVDPNQTFGNGSISLTPVPDTVQMTYSWVGPNGPMGTNAAYNNLDSGFYSVTVTNPNSGCTAVYTYNLKRQWADIAAVPQFTNASCVNTANGMLNWNVTGGAPNLSYEWTGPNGPLSNDNAMSLSGLLPGSYTVTVTDAEGTTQTFTATLPSQSNLIVTNVNELSNYNGYQVSGANQCDGIASVVFSGGVGGAAVLWSNNKTGTLNNTLCAGAYSVTVTDGLGCTAVWNDNLTFPPAVALNQSMVSEISCNRECDGIARVTVNGGIAPYEVKWSTGQTDENVGANGFSQAVNLCAGDYKVTVTDNQGASYVFDVPVVEPAPIVISFADVTPSSFNACDGELLALAPGAVDPINYTWSGSLGHSGNGQRAEGLCSGEIVQFLLVDGNGCTGFGIDTVAYATDGCYRVRPVITPGLQDGNNDFVIITCIETVPNSIEIFNRWGQLVFETSKYDNDANVWDGRTKEGQPLAEGVYFYVLRYNDPVLGLQTQKGHINLLR
jgi:gliding motility-associated-like protein